MNRDDILIFLRDNKSVIEHDFGVTTIGLCGSYARNEASENSDIDIVVEMLPTRIFRNFMGLEQFLAMSFSKRIDLGIKSSLKEYVIKRIEKDIIYV